MLDMSSANRVGNGRLKCTETAIFIRQTSDQCVSSRKGLRYASPVGRESGRNSSSWVRGQWDMSRFPVASHPVRVELVRRQENGSQMERITASSDDVISANISISCRCTIVS